MSARFPSASAILARPRPGNGCAGSTLAATQATSAAAAGTFEQARAEFEAAWRVYLPKRSEADFQAWRDQQAWTAEKYRRFDRGERMPPDWRAGELRRPPG
jgi:Ni/Co efflux regulator RcnB